MKPHVRLRVPNFQFLRQQPPKEFDWLRIDANDNCNLKCVYCRVPRSDGMITAEDLATYFEENVISVENLQFGCGMEPTIDDRLADLMLLASRSNAKPKQRFGLQTNGLMLHRHDYAKFNRSGLNRITVSMDSMDGEKHKSHRGGSSLQKVLRNLEGFKLGCPDIEINLVSVVTKLNVTDMEPLVEFALDLGVSSVSFREMVYVAESLNVDHDALRPLVLDTGEFAGLKDSIESKFGNGPAYLSFHSNQALGEYREKSNKDSNPPPKKFA